MKGKHRENVLGRNMKELSTRKKIRLQGYDYSSNGAYYITVCVKDRHELLWKNLVVGARSARPQLSEIGAIVEATIKTMPQIYPAIELDTYVIMPNHIHMIVIIKENLPENHGRAENHVHAENLPENRRREENRGHEENHGRVENHEHPAEDHGRAENRGRALRAPTISCLINQMKGSITKKIGYAIWQKSFYDHIIRNEAEYRRIRQYIEQNPQKWQEDEYYVKPSEGDGYGKAKCQI